MYWLARFILAIAVIFSFVCFAEAASESWPTSGVFLAVVFFAYAGKRGVIRLTTLGSAKWAEEHDLRLAGMLSAKRGLIIGRLHVRNRFPFGTAIAALMRRNSSAKESCADFLAALKRRRTVLVRLPNAIHTTVFSPSGGGKGVSCVVPFLKTCEESCVVVDFKGENARLTAEHRCKNFGHQIICLDPYKVVTDRPATFNPLSFIDKENLLAIDECNELAKALVLRTGEEKEPHWNDSAEAWIAALSAMIVQLGADGDETRSLQMVREVLSSPPKLEKAISLMLESNAWNGMLSRIGGQLTHFIDKEKSSTLTTVGRHLRFLDSLPVLDNTKVSSFDPAHLRRGKMTVYLILPPSQMQTQAPLLRLWISSCFRGVVAGGLQERNLVHFILDEASSLGHFEAINDAIDKYRGYGIRLQLYYQSMGQLKKCFPNGQDQTLLSNTTQVFFGVNDQAIGTGGTADYVSARLGEETIIVDSGGDSSSKSYQTSSGPQQRSSSTSHSFSTNRNWQQQARKLYKPEEVVALPPRTAITFTPGVPPIRTTLLRYYEEPRLGIRPGRLRRLLTACGTLAACVLVSISMMIVSLGLILAVQDVQKSRPKIAPVAHFPNSEIKGVRPGVPAD
jgi:type IV secretion system protein VirD4